MSNVFMYSATPGESLTFVSSGTTTTIKSTRSTWTANQWVGDVAIAVGLFESRQIASNTTDTLTVSPAFSGAPSAGSAFAVRRRYPVEPGGAQRTDTVVGDKHRAFDGTMRGSVFQRVTSYRVTTTPVTLADASSMIASIESSSQPQQWSGAFISTAIVATNFDSRLVGLSYVHTADGQRVRIEFEIEESS